MRIFPAIDIIDGKTVRLEQGKYEKELRYSLKPLEAAERWKDAGASWLHIVDLDGAKAGRPVNFELIDQIARDVAIPVQTGGGYRKVEDIERALKSGISRVIIGSSATEEEGFAKEVIGRFGKDVIISCDADAFKIKTRGWLKSEGVDFFEFLKKLKGYGAERIIYTDIQRDGMLAGPAFPRVKEVIDGTDLSVILAGGVRSVDDIKKLKELQQRGLEGVIVGRALYEGTINLGEAIRVGEKNCSMS